MAKSKWIRVYAGPTESLILVSVPGTFWWAGRLESKKNETEAYWFVERFRCACQKKKQRLILLHYEPSLQIFWARFGEGNHVCTAAKSLLEVPAKSPVQVKLKYIPYEDQMGLVGMWWQFKGVPTGTPICWEGCSGSIAFENHYFFPVDYLYRVGRARVESLKRTGSVLLCPMFSSCTHVHNCEHTDSLEAGRWIGCRINFKFIGHSSLVCIVHSLLKQRVVGPQQSCWIYSSYCSHEIKIINAEIPLEKTKTMLMSVHDISTASFSLGKYQKQGKNLYFPDYQMRFSQEPSLSCCFSFLLSRSVHDSFCFRRNKGKVLSLTYCSHVLPEKLRKFPLRLSYPCKISTKTNKVILRVEIKEFYFIFFVAHAE